MAWIKTEVKLPDVYSANDAREIGEAIVEYIIDRTREGKGEDGKPFRGSYSKDYTETLDFEIAGKSKSKIDLTQTGEMLDSLVVLEAKRGKVVFGYPEGDPNNEKAEGNILGSYGGQPNKSRARNFMAISENEVSKILENFPEERFRSLNTKISKAARERAIEIVDRFDFDYEEDV